MTDPIISLLLLVLLGAVILSIALWAVAKLPLDGGLIQVVRVVIIAIFLIWLYRVVVGSGLL